MRNPLLAFILIAWAAALSAGQAWESALYDNSWSPLPTLTFDSDKLIQDFSYAGYKRGEAPLPFVSGPVFDAVTGYGADSTGTSDSTAAIQAAINAAELAGGGVVYLPAGTYRVAPPSGQTIALRIRSSNIVLRGAGSAQTFLLNTSTEMRSKSVISASSAGPFWYWDSGTDYAVTADLLTPTVRIPVADTSPFTVGDAILIRNDITTAWVNEHNEPGWLGFENSLSGIAYHREIMGIDTGTSELLIDVPTRYAMKMRDNTRIYIRNHHLTGVGVESLSIGNIQHPGTSWGEGDYTDDMTAAGQAHASWLIRFRNLKDSWVRDVATFQPAGNTTTAHLLSNGLSLLECRGITVSNCFFQRPQYGGGGGNGYMFRLQHANECLIENSTAEFSRHGFVFSHMGSAGNVFRNCTDRKTGKSTGSTGNLNTSGKGSDHHMQFSHSNLIDVCTADESYFSAHYRPYGTGPMHRLTAAHGVYWNTRGLTSSPFGHVVHSQQSRYGYVIGTRGTITSVRTSGTDSYKTDPVDHVEGVGEGDLLDPFSLSLDQRRKRLALPKVDTGPDRELFFPNDSLTMSPNIRFGDSPDIPAGASVTWSQTSGPTSAMISDPDLKDTLITFPVPGEYVLECLARSAHGFDTGDFVHADSITVTVYDLAIEQTVIFPTDDAYVRGGATNENDNFGTASTLWMKQVNNVSFERESFLKFDLSSFVGKTVTKADLMLHGLEPDFEATGSLDQITEDNWNEESLTWATRPNSVGSSQSWTPDPEFMQIFDLSNQVATEAAGDTLLSLRVRINSQTNSSTVFKFASKENSNAALHPRISILSELTPAQMFSKWIESFPSVPVIDRGQLADPDGDSFSNLSEFVHGGSPSLADRSIATIYRNHYLEFWIRSSLTPQEIITVERSLTLANESWALLPDVVFEEVESPPTNLKLIRAHFPQPTTELSRSFFRLTYTLP